MKRITAFILAAMMLLALMACQVTPDQALVVKKDTERMVEKAADNAAGTKVSKLKVPQGNYTYHTSAADGKLDINVDAPVSVPKSGMIPTAKVSETGFTQQQVKDFFNYLFPDEKPVTGDNVEKVMTKDEIQELILTYKKYVAEGSVEKHTLYTNEEIQDEIKKMEKELASAPKTAPKHNTQISDGTMTAEKTTGDKYAGEKIMRLEAQTKDKSIAVCVPVDNNAGFENYFMFDKEAEYSEMNAVKIDEANWQSAAKGKLAITYEDAKKLCDGFFSAGKMTDAALSDAFMIDDEVTKKGHAHKPEHYAYQFNYVRTVGDSPAANMSYLCSQGDENALPWFYERIVFRVDDKGIVSIDWASHTMTGEMINKDTGVIGFDKAQEIFKNMIVTTYGASKQWPKGLNKVSIDINDIKLSPVRVREQNASGRTGVYTPSWVFYGNIKREFNVRGKSYAQYGWNLSGEYPFTKYPVLVINAVDGSIIDPQKGY